MIDIGFVHVKGHSGDAYNDKADELAKTGAGILEETFAEDAEVKEPAKKGKKTKDLPGIGEGINPRCEKAIRLFRKKRNPRFKDFVELKSYGQDKYSRLKEEGLILILGEDVCEEIRGKVNEPEGYLPALRWAARGVVPEPGIIRTVPVVSHDKIRVFWDCVWTKAAFCFLRGKTVIQRFFAAVNIDVPVFDLHCLSGESDDPLYI